MMSLEYWYVFAAVPVAIVVLGHAVFAALSYVAYRSRGAA
jgi:hypothetical protein